MFSIITATLKSVAKGQICHISAYVSPTVGLRPPL